MFQKFKEILDDKESIDSEKVHYGNYLNLKVLIEKKGKN